MKNGLNFGWKIWSYSIILLLSSSGFRSSAQLPDPVLLGYFHNWNDVSAPYIPLDQVDSRYNVIAVAFAIPMPGTDYRMQFIPDQATPSAFTSQIQYLQSQGKKVLLSIGGATAPVSLDNQSERDTFIASIGRIIRQYGFDGIDIDLEGSSLSVSGGSISNPVDQKVINLIQAIRTIMSDHRLVAGEKLLLTMAPETAFVQGGQSAYGGVWGAYLPVIDALRDSLDLLHVQLYNSGSMYGPDGNIYSSGTPDFIVAMTEAVIQGFNTSGGYFQGIPSTRIAIGLPACPSAAGSGYVSPMVVESAIDYLQGSGPRPGNYILQQPSGYPSLRGMMTWSINWDATSNCTVPYEFASNFESIFSNPSTGITPDASNTGRVYPNPAQDFIFLATEGYGHEYKLYSVHGIELSTGWTAYEKACMDISFLPAGVYFLTIGGNRYRFIKT